MTIFAIACGTAKPGGMSGPSMDNRMSPEPMTPQYPLQSNDILDREADANRVEVKHILISWKDLEDNFDGAIDPRAKDRTAEEAEALVETLYERATAGEPFEGLMAEYSEDRGSARSGQTIEVTPAAGLVLDFKRLSLRLRVGEIGIVRTTFGWHIIKRYA